MRATLMGEKLDKKWTGRPSRSLESISEYATRHGGKLVWEGYKFYGKEKAMVTLCEHSELKQRRHIYRDKVHYGEKKKHRHNDSCIRDLCPVATCEFIYEEVRKEGQ